MATPIACNLTENSIDYLLLAGEQVQEGSDRMIKHSVATLADGVELLLKSRIEEKDWSLLFKEIDKACRSKYESGDFISITFDQATKRLKNLCDVEIADKQLTIVNELRQSRNRIRHFAISIDAEVAMSLVAKTFSFALSFIAEHLPHANDDCSEDLVAIRELLGKFDEFVDERFKQIQAKLDAHSSPEIDCPVCLQTAYMIEGDRVRCYFCEHEAPPDSAAEEWVDTFLPYRRLKDSLIDPKTRECPECSSESCVFLGAETDGRIGHLCFSCGQEGDYHDCCRCGALCDSGCDACGDCRDAYMTRNE